jgi:membrane-bound inhibitor of C-type lysozyme
MHFAPRLLPFILVLSIVACKDPGPTKEEQEIAKKTIDCDLAGDRVLIRFEEGEARLLMPDATRPILYQVASASGLRYTNGYIDLRGRGMELQLTRDAITMKMTCKPYELPAKKE